MIPFGGSLEQSDRTFVCLLRGFKDPAEAITNPIVISNGSSYSRG
jgi:hypothetical protein